MKYDFHVGDYVETLEEKVGYIERIQTLTNDRTCLYITFRDNRTYPYDMNEEGLKFRFKRIGQYDFTKKDEGKIEPLAEKYIKSFSIYKTTITGNDSEWRSIDIGAVSKKINELVDAVNRLEEKVNEMAQS